MKAVDMKKNSNFIWHLKHKEEINPDVFWYTFENSVKRIDVAKFYDGLYLAGKGYTLTWSSGLGSIKSRYYTICTTMGSYLYEQYRNMCLAVIDGKEYNRLYKTTYEIK